MLQERLRAPAGGLFSIKQQAGGLPGEELQAPRWSMKINKETSQGAGLLHLFSIADMT